MFLIVQVTQDYSRERVSYQFLHMSIVYNSRESAQCAMETFEGLNPYNDYHIIEVGKFNTIEVDYYF
jgi:hypothetical protein